MHWYRRSLILFVSIYTAVSVPLLYLHVAQAQSAPSLTAPGQQAQTGCGDQTMTFGCHAYLIGPGGAAKAASLAGKVNTAAVDTQQMLSNPGLVQKMNQSGPMPILYTNAFCESRFGGCQGPFMSSQTSSQWGEPMPDPRGPGFAANFQRQLGWVKQLGGKVIEIDNIDSYIEKGQKNAVIQLIKMAQNQGINVVSKNVSDPAILGLPNVVGAIVEPGSGSAQQYRSGFQSAGKKCAGVVIINGGGGGDPYTSFTRANQGGQSEYTDFKGCTPNSAGTMYAGTPVAGGEVPPIGDQGISSSGGTGGGGPSGGGGGSPSSGGSPSGGGGSSGGGSSPQSQPQQQPQLQQFPQQTPQVVTKTEKPPETPEKKEVPEKKQGFEVMKTQQSDKKQNAQLSNPLGFGAGDDQKQTKQAEDAPDMNDGGARISCTPKTVPLGTKVVVSWMCKNAKTSYITTDDKRVVIDTQSRTIGSIKIVPKTKVKFSLTCESDGEKVGSATCTVVTRKSQARPTTQSFDSSTTVKEEAAPSCFFGFCM